jgi:hypothetical protein
VGIPDKHDRRRFLSQESPRRWNPTLSGPPAFLTLTLAPCLSLFPFGLVSLGRCGDRLKQPAGRD